jgi:drug/metabolite transporter (DMT)-like permease
VTAPPLASRALFDRPYLLLSLTSLFWAINIVLGRFIAGTVPPAALAEIRWVGAALVAVPLARRQLIRDWPAIRSHLGIMLLLSFTGVTVYNTLAYHGLEYTTALNGSLMQSSAPLMIGLWSLILFRDRLTPAQLFGIMVSLLGVLVIIAHGDATTLAHLKLNPGDLWFLIAMASYALYAALLRRRPAVHFLSFLAFTFVAGAIMLAPATVAEYVAGRRIDPTPAAFAVLAYVIVFPSLFAYVLFNRGVELIGANRAGPFFHLIPVFGSAIAIVFLGERPQLHHGIGYALIIAGIAVAQRGGRKARQVVDS